jgi:hypothetical protein
MARRRLLALGLVCVMIGMPLAGDVCEVVCAEHAAASSASTSAGHHDHHHSTVATGESAHHNHSPAVPLAMWRGTPTPMSHECPELEAAITESRQLQRAPVVEAAEAMILVNYALVRVRPASETDGRHFPPAPVHSRSLLRI